MNDKTPTPDIIIHGAGIAGLWTFHRLKKLGYDVLLLEKDAIGGGQSIASQGIIHSGLKYAIAGQVNELARQISKMPDIWNDALEGKGDVDISSARISPESQYMLIPEGFMGGLVKIVSKKALGRDVYELDKADWPEEIVNSGFRGAVIHMNEPVLNIPRVIRGLASPYKDCIKKSSDEQLIQAKLHIYTAAASNIEVARIMKHDKGLQTQKRPLLMGMIKNAPFHLNAHLIGTSEKPVATITTHQCSDGTPVWYIGGAAAERKKDADPKEVYDATTKALKKYLPTVYHGDFEWATLPIDRVEGKSETSGWMPDTPTVHAVDDHLYCWPTKLTFAPLLSDTIMKHIQSIGLSPSNQQSDYSHLEDVDYAAAPWDKVSWTKDA